MESLYLLAPIVRTIFCFVMLTIHDLEFTVNFNEKKINFSHFIILLVFALFRAVCTGLLLPQIYCIVCMDKFCVVSFISFLLDDSISQRVASNKMNYEK